MFKLFSNTHIIRILSFTLLFLSSVNISASNSLSFQEVQKPLYARSPENLSFHVDPSSGPVLAYKYKDSQTPGDVFFTRLNNDSWIEPQPTNILNSNEFQLGNTAALNQSSSMMLLRGDDTDYLKVFGLSTPPEEPLNDTDPVIPGISNDELDVLLNNNRRLFYSLNGGSGWSKGQVIPGTNKAINPVLYSAADNTAIAVYSIDADDNAATINDIDLYYVYYANNVWGQPVRLTNNSLLDYAVKVTHVNGEYLVTWMTDEDSNINTAADSRLYHSTIASTGVINKLPATVLLQANANPLYTLGVSGTTAILVWSETLADGSQLLKETRYSNSVWSATQSTTFDNSSFTKAKIFDVNGNQLLVHQLGGSIYLSRHNGTGWAHIDTITDLIDKSINVSEIEFAVINNTLWLAYSGRTAIVNEGQDPDVGDGLYIAGYPLSYDLSVDLISTNLRSLNIGQDVELSVDVKNNGFFDSANYQLELRQAGTLLTSLTGTSLSANGKQNFKYTLTPQAIETPITATIIADALDTDTTNNSRDYLLAVKPDFYIKSVEKTAATTIKVDVRERKGMSISASPSVDAYLVQGNVQTPVATAGYNPSSVEPVLLDISQLSTLTGDYKILVKINKSKVIAEDSYTNNSHVYENKVATEPDYSISSLSVSDTEVSLYIKNTGVLNASAVDLLITDDPLQAGQQSAIASPWYFQQVTLDATGNSTLTIQRTALPQITGQYLYAVINPYNTILETDRNNNRIQKLVSAIAVPVGTVSAAYLNQNYICENLSFDISNTGTVSAQQVTATLTNSYGIVVASTQLPLLQAGATEGVTFHGIKAAEYTVGISHMKDNKPDSLVVQTVNLVSDGCVASTNINDINLSSLNYIGINATTGLSEFDIDLRITGYSVDYRKPLIRVPLDIEVKQGTSLISSRTLILYTSPMTNQNLIRIQLAASELPTTGGYTFIARIKNRTDETQTSNNILTANVN